MPEVLRDPQPSDPFEPAEEGPLGILVGIDGSDRSVDALRYAVDLAPKLGMDLRALAVWSYPTLLYGNYAYPESEPGPEQDARLTLERATREVLGDDIPSWYTAATHRGLPAQTLIERSKTSQMLVVGSRGRGGFAGLLLGSVSSACAAHAHCPVLIIHHARAS
jgi:nucleotide-binding universal stress UspA family protein